MLAYLLRSLIPEREIIRSSHKRFTGTSYFYTREQLTSVREMTNGLGQIKSQYSYDAYGRALKTQGGVSSDFNTLDFILMRRAVRTWL